MLEVAGAAHDEQREHEGADAERRPHRLQASQVGVEAGDEHVADAVQQAGEGEEDAVGVGGEASGGQVRHREQAHDDGQERHQVGGKTRGAAEGREHVAAGHDHRPEHD